MSQETESVLKFHLFTEIEYFSVNSLKSIHNASLNPENILFAAIKLQGKTLKQHYVLRFDH